MRQSKSEFWNAHADKFDSIYREDSRVMEWFNSTFRKAIYDRFYIALAESGDVTGKAILDIGCGSGRYVVEYAKRGAGRVVGVDFSPSMLELARDLAIREGVQDRCQFIEGDFWRLELEDPFDVVLAMGVFDYIGEAETFLAKMVRTSRDLVIASFPGKSKLRMHLRRLRYRVQGCPVFFYTEEQLQELIAATDLGASKLVYIPHSGSGYVLVGRR